MPPGIACHACTFSTLSTRFSRRGIPAVGEMQNIYKGKQAEYEEQEPEENPENK